MVSRALLGGRIRVDTLLVSGFTLITGILAVRFEIFERLIFWTSQSEYWKLDEIFSVLLVSSFSLTWLAVSRSHSMKIEVRRRETSEKLAKSLARHDALTGLPNRRLLSERFALARRRVKAKNRQLAVLLLDLDRFKPVNDVYGHAAGDLVLCATAARINELAEAAGSCIVARLGGDEFACVLEYDRDSDAPLRMANQMVVAVEQKIDIGEREIEIGASVGIATASDTREEIDELLRKADVAMYRAKREGRGTFRSFEKQMDAELRHRAAVEADLRAGLPRGEIVPYFQPIMALPGHELVGFEALARWNHPTKGMVPPDDFISIAEDCHLIDQLFFRLLERACDDARAWPANLGLSVNVSPIQLGDPWLAQRILKTLTETGFAPGRLTIGLTENAVVDDLAAARSIITSLKSAGAKVALDDFGTGYSSLTHLRTLQFDSIKIDRSFVLDMRNAHDVELVRAIIGMGHSLGMRVTAEGVENPSDLSTLANLDCNHVQGYLLGRPATAEDVLTWIARGAPDGEVQAPARRAARAGA